MSITKTVVLVALLVAFGSSLPVCAQAVSPFAGLQFIVVPLTQVTSVGSNFKPFIPFRAEPSSTPPSLQGLEILNVTPTDYRKGMVLMVETPDGGTDFSKWANDARYSFFYAVSPSNADLDQIKSNLDNAISAKKLTPIDLSRYPGSDTIKNGQYRLLPDVEPRLKNLGSGDFVIFVFRYKELSSQTDIVMYTAVWQMAPSEGHWFMPLITFTDGAALLAGQSTVLFQTVPVVSVGWSYLWNQSVNDAIGLGGAVTFDPLWLVDKAGQQVSIADIEQNWVNSIYLSVFFHWKRNGQDIVIGPGLHFVYDPNTKTINWDWGATVGTNLIQLVKTMFQKS